jgi:hypothetical protein
LRLRIAKHEMQRFLGRRVRWPDGLPIGVQNIERIADHLANEAALIPEKMPPDPRLNAPDDASG